jgi:hypothetical protein
VIDKEFSAAINSRITPAEESGPACGWPSPASIFAKEAGYEEFGTITGVCYGSSNRFSRKHVGSVRVLGKTQLLFELLLLRQLL